MQHCRRVAEGCAADGTRGPPIAAMLQHWHDPFSQTCEGALAPSVCLSAGAAAALCWPGRRLLLVPCMQPPGMAIFCPHCDEAALPAGLSLF